MLFGLLLLGGASALHAQSAPAAPSPPMVEEVPFVTTPDNVTLEMLQLAGVGPKDHVLDLGSGDGRIVIVAAKRFGATGMGVEIVPDLVVKSRENARNAGVADRVQFLEQDLFKTDLDKASVITMYLLPEVNMQLRPQLLQLRPGTRIVSHDWDMGDWPATRTVVVDAPNKTVGKDKRSTLHLWVVPAQVEGLWCGWGRYRGAALYIDQRYSRLEARLKWRGPWTTSFRGRVDGARVQLDALGPLATISGDDRHLRVINGLSLGLIGASFQRAFGPFCD